MLRRSLSNVLVVLLVSSLLALTAGPGISKDGEQDERALYSACPEGSSILESANFRDLAGYPDEFENAINCMANYGIMPGLSSGMFEPGAGVTRQQMALILIRAAGPAGIDIPIPRDQGFRDIGELESKVQDSINQLADLGITRGTTPSTYVPDTVVNRRQMAQFFTRFLALAPVGEGGASVDSVSPDDRVFTDIDTLPHEPYNAIRALYELGVTKGVTATTYGPDQPVTRAQMALFVSRMLAHTNARPAGVTLQVERTSVTAGDTVDLAIAVRDSNHMPMLDALVDIFYVADDDDGFSRNGRCSSRVVRESGNTVCRIDADDEINDGDGNLPYDAFAINEDLTVYAWTGNSDEEFDLDSTDYASLKFNTSKAASNFLITDDMPKGATDVRYRTTVTFTFQLVDEDEKPVQEEGVEIRIETIEDNQGRNPVPRARTYSTDSTGQVEVSLRLTDPDSGDGDSGTIKIDVLRSDEPPLDRTTVEILTGSNRVRWSDADAEPSTLLIEQRSVYSTASSSGNGPSNRVTATLLDQYGDPVRRERIHFTSDDRNGLSSEEGKTDALRGHQKTTGNTGTASVTYNRDSSASGIETIEASVEGESINSEEIKHYWVEELSRGSNSGSVVYEDEDRNTLIIRDGTKLYGITFDRNDQFNTDSGAVSFDDFKEALEAKTGEYTITVVYSSDNVNDVNRFVIT